MGQIVLVRHGQASFGTDDYDRLSAAGVAQSERLGEFGVCGDSTPATLSHGTMRRQADTAAGIVRAAGWPVTATADPRWNEYDHLSLASSSNQTELPTDPRQFQALLEDQLRAWIGGEADGAESYAEFSDRVRTAFEETVNAHEGLSVVVSSGGVISWLVNHVLGGGPEQWILLNRVCVNTGVTRFLVGRSGVSLLSFNDHAHLPREMVSYR